MMIRRPVGGIVTVEPARERSTAAKQSISLDALCAGACRAVGARQTPRRRASSKEQQSYPCPRCAENLIMLDLGHSSEQFAQIPGRQGGFRQSPGSRLAIQWSPRFSNFSFRTVNAALSA